MADRHTSAAQAGSTKSLRITRSTPRSSTPHSIPRAALRTVALPLVATGLIAATTLVPSASASGSIVHQSAKVPAYKVSEGVELKPAFVTPLASYRLTAHFGASNGPWANGHTGLDFAAPSGTPIRSIGRGVVVSAEYDGAYGNKVVVRLQSGAELWFCHMTEMHVRPGQHVTTAQQLGTVGSTGNSTGPHLHLEVHLPNGEVADPESWLAGKNLHA